MELERSARALVRAYHEGRRRPEEVLEGVYGAIAKHGRAPIWIATHSFETALRALERAPKDGPLYGVPFAVKDNIDVAGLPTTAGCPEFAYEPQESAEVVARCVAAGAIVIGKTNLDQFATGLVGTRSPYGIPSSVFDPRYIAGGSSSGSAVAVARGDVLFSLGTDTAGSGRIPAAFNGLVGLKPTRGLVSTRGVVPACRSLDCVSVFSHDVDDAELVLGVVGGYDAKDPFSRRAEALPRELGPAPRLGVPAPNSLEFFGDDDSARAFAASVERLKGSVDAVIPVDLRLFREAASLLYEGPWIAERLAAVGPFLERNPEAVHPVVRGIIEQGRHLTARQGFEGAYRLAELARQTAGIWRDIDALVVPTAPTHYTIDDVLREPLALNRNLGTYTNFVNLLDLAALAVPCGLRAGGLPFGITFIAPAFHDLRLLELARKLSPASGTERNAPPPGSVWLAVAGAHLSGQPLNHELTTRGARRVRVTKTAAEYRLYALATTPPKPGLVHAPAEGGHAIEVEVWELSERAFGSFVASVPAPMTIGATLLEDGTRVKGFSCEPYALSNAKDISSWGGWRAYLGARTAPIA